jgi:hypothetical protein
VRFGPRSALGAASTKPSRLPTTSRPSRGDAFRRLGVAESRRLFGVPKVALAGLDGYFVALRLDQAQKRFLARFAEHDA